MGHKFIPLPKKFSDTIYQLIDINIRTLFGRPCNETLLHGFHDFLPGPKFLCIVKGLNH